jgi:hypothetical protein
MGLARRLMVKSEIIADLEHKKTAKVYTDAVC